MDDRDNYYTPERSYIAVRVPQVEGNAKLLNRITAGEIHQGEARSLELECMRALKSYDKGTAGVEEPLAALRKYEQLYDGRRDRTAAYREVLTDRPWKSCPCEICGRLGFQVVLFRGAERNRRRGFHNLFVTHRRILAGLLPSPRKLSEPN